MKQHLRKGNKEIRKESAKQRFEEYKLLTIQQKLDKLDKKLGKGIGAVKERLKLIKNMKEPQKEIPKKEVVKKEVLSVKDKFIKKYSKKQVKEKENNKNI